MRPEEQWAQKTRGTVGESSSGYRGPVGAEEERKSEDRGGEEQWGQRNSWFIGPEE